jgi:hypothetical protein
MVPSVSLTLFKSARNGQTTVHMGDSCIAIVTKLTDEIVHHKEDDAVLKQQTEDLSLLALCPPPHNNKDPVVAIRTGSEVLQRCRGQYE